MSAHMTSVVDDDIRTAGLADDAIEEDLVVLRSAERLDPRLVVRTLVLDVDAEDPPAGEIRAPHPQGCPSGLGSVVAADPDLEEGDLPPPQPGEVGLVVLSVSMESPFIGAVESRQGAQVRAE